MTGIEYLLSLPTGSKITLGESEFTVTREKARSVFSIPGIDCFIIRDHRISMNLHPDIERRVGKTSEIVAAAAPPSTLRYLEIVKLGTEDVKRKKSTGNVIIEYHIYGIQLGGWSYRTSSIDCDAGWIKDRHGLAFQGWAKHTGGTIYNSQNPMIKGVDVVLAATSEELSSGNVEIINCIFAVFKD